MSETPVPSALRRLAVIVPALLTLLLMEGAMRVYYAVHNRADPPPIEVARERGWRSRPSVDERYTLKGYGEVQYTTDERGFRMFGDPTSDRLRVLVLGDSFTQAKQVSDGRPYYARLAQLRPGEIEIFAYGAGGYGTLQQAMVLDAWVDEIAPSLVLWQFSMNDLINNDYGLESRSNERNNHMRRPYWEGGEIVYRHPDRGLAALARFSLVARRLRIFIDSVQQRTEGTIEADLSLDDAEFRRAVETTGEIFRWAARRAGTTPIVAFQASPLDRFGFEDEAFRRVCAAAAELDCIADMLDRMRTARDTGTPIDGEPSDGHWNEAGHRLAAERILERLEARGYLDAAGTAEGC